MALYVKVSYDKTIMLYNDIDKNLSYCWCNDHAVGDDVGFIKMRKPRYREVTML